MQRDMEGEIRAIMREYMPLPAGEDAAEAGRGSSFFSRGGGGGGENGRKMAFAGAPAGVEEGYQAPQVARTRSNSNGRRGGAGAGGMQLTPLSPGGNSPL
jgi:hypothetical protein